MSTYHDLDLNTYHPMSSNHIQSNTSAYNTENDLLRFNETTQLASTSPLTHLLQTTKQRAQQSTHQLKPAVLRHTIINTIKASIPCIQWLQQYLSNIKQWLLRD